MNQTEISAYRLTDEIIKIHKDAKTVRQAILNNVVNSKYTQNRVSNQFIDAMWVRYNQVFKN